MQISITLPLLSYVLHSMIMLLEEDWMYFCFLDMRKGTRPLKKAIMIKLQIHQTQAIQSITASCRRLGSCRQQHFLVIELLVFYNYQIRILKPLVAFADKIIFILHSQVSWLNLQKNTTTFSQKVCFSFHHALLFLRLPVHNTIRNISF